MAAMAVIFAAGNSSIEAAAKKNPGVEVRAPASDEAVYTPTASEADQIRQSSRQKVKEYVSKIRAQYEGQLKELAEQRDVELKTVSEKFNLKADPPSSSWCETVPKTADSAHDIYHPSSALIARIEDARSFQVAADVIRRRCAAKANKIRGQFNSDISELNVSGDMALPLSFPLPRAAETGITESQNFVSSVGKILINESSGLYTTLVGLLAKVGQKQETRLRQSIFWGHESHYECLGRAKSQLSGLNWAKEIKAVQVEESLRKTRDALEQARQYTETTEPQMAPAETMYKRGEAKPRKITHKDLHPDEKDEEVDHSLDD